MAVNVSQLQEAIKNLLSPREQIEFIELTNDFHSKRNVAEFAESLRVSMVIFEIYSECYQNECVVAQSVLRETASRVSEKREM